MRSLTFKLIVAFLVTSVLGVGLAAVLARGVTTREFSQFVMGQLRNEFVANAAAYYRAHGSWAGASEYFRQMDVPPPLEPGPPPEPGAPPRPLQFVLADQNGLAVTPVEPYRPGDLIPVAELARGAPVEVAGRRVGTVIDVASAPALSPREIQYLASTNRALLLAALGAAVIALLFGVVLARTLTRPLRDLTQAIDAMTAGELKQEVPVRSADELGTLTQAFNRMSTDLTRSNELRRQMTADIAHELRTPLTVVRAYVDGLLDGTFKPTPARFEAMQAETQHLQRLVEDLRTLSLADAGELPMQRVSTSCLSLLDRLAAAYAPQAGARDIALQVSVEPELPDIVVDPERVIQVLGNLVTNALRYTPSGGQIALTARRDALPHVFDRFYRGDPARSQEGDESGLGLAIAKAITEAHGGRITVESELGRGTTFTVLLPVG